MLKLEDLKVGNEYINNDGDICRLEYLGNNNVIYRLIDRPREIACPIDWFTQDFSTIPKCKRKFWLWDIKSEKGIAKSNFYLDENGKTTNCKVPYGVAYTLLRKHENEFIEVEDE